MTIRRLDKRNYHSVGLVVDEEIEEISSCSTCAANGVMSKLKQRLYLDDKGKLLPPPPDADDWLQCWICGLVVPSRDVKQSGKISGIQGVEPVENPFSKKSKILGIDSKHRYQKLKKRQNKHSDAEVQKLLEEGWEVTSYKQVMPT
jgi:hypothetical protein